MNEDFENFNVNDEEWLTELENRAADLQNELFDWREAHSREAADAGYDWDEAPPVRETGTREARPGMLRAQPGTRRLRATPSRPRRCTTSSTTKTPIRTTT